MTRVRIKGFKIFHDRYGKLRCYHRATNTRIDLEKYPFGSVEFIAQCEAIAKKNEVKKASAGSLGKILELYQASSAFTSLADRTKKDYIKQFDYLKPLSHLDLADFDRAFVMQIRDKAEAKKGWHFANYITRTMSAVFTWAIDRGHMDSNPAANIKAIKRPKDLERANRPWTDQELMAVLSAAPWKLKVPLAIMAYTGLRPQDALKLRKDAFDGTMIRYKTGKTGQEVRIFALRPLREILAAAPAHLAMTIAATEHGRPWSYMGFSARWREWKAKQTQIATDGLTLYGLRHTIATILREEGFDTQTIADYLGQANEAMARHYSRDADLSKKMQAAGEKMEIALEGRQSKIVKLS